MTESNRRAVVAIGIMKCHPCGGCEMCTPCRGCGKVSKGNELYENGYHYNCMPCGVCGMQCTGRSKSVIRGKDRQSRRWDCACATRGAVLHLLCFGNPSPRKYITNNEISDMREYWKISSDDIVICKSRHVDYQWILRPVNCDWCTNIVPGSGLECGGRIYCDSECDQFDQPYRELGIYIKG